MNDNQTLQLQELDAACDFLRRHIGPSTQEQQYMLQELGYSCIEQLVDSIVPEDILERQRIESRIPDALSENDILCKLEAISQKNVQLKSLIGQGYYNNHTPEVIIRNVLENPGWYTAYTPYQAEISQGRLEALANFQTVVMDLTELPIANASLLDEASAAAEAMAMCLRGRTPALRKKDNAARCFFVADNCHPQSIDIVQNRARPLGVEVLVAPIDELPNYASKLFGVLMQYPGTCGEICDYSREIELLHQHGALAVLACDLISLTLLKTPGEMAADIAIGSAQRFGVPLAFGGPHAAFMSCSQALQRSMPGRIIGLSKDRHGKMAYRMSMQTREQHIRREKATSNICTSQALLAVIASFYAIYFGPKGLKRIAQRINALTCALAAGLRSAAYRLHSEQFFDTVCIDSGEKTELLLQLALEKGYNLRRVDSTHLSMSFDDTTKQEDVATLLNEVFLKLAEPQQKTVEELSQSYGTAIPCELQRKSSYMEHPVFHSKHSETQMMRYMRYLVNKDIALDRSMIPLGSCTMKLNAATEMKALSLSGFANIHPFAPSSQSQGYRMLITELEYFLCALTGYDAVSLQPNAGSQGEFAGLLAIRAYHESHGEAQRNICLIPSSAHGTNPASANMAGMRVVPVGCDSNGNIDITHLQTQCEKHSQALACIMITYPSTHGVFEATVRQVCDIVHQAGGQVYIDGANMNAQVGLAYPGLYGGDVSHLNLHKTFAIPHGGGGPGVGPLLVKSHLADYLPGHKVIDNGRGRSGAVAAAPWGSASILIVTYAYISLLGYKGLQKASEVAILSANYIAKKLEPYYPVLYKGKGGHVAHECIVDIRPLEKQTGISCEDIAKRLMDFGIHAPTMAFPVPGTLMVEPTESEPLEELDRFITAMVCIRKEIDEVQNGECDIADNVLKNAPHTMQEVAASGWKHSYSREKAAFPLLLSGLNHEKIWPAVGRINNVFGDRNLFCACAPPETWQTDSY